MRVLAPTNASRYEYPYDALHRRVIEYKYVDYGDQLPADPEVARVDLYYSSRWQVIEDQSEHSGLNSADSVAIVLVGILDDPHGRASALSGSLEPEVMSRAVLICVAVAAIDPDLAAWAW